METLEAMTLTEAVKAVNEAGFTLHIDRRYPEEGVAGRFKASGGTYTVEKTIDGLDGYIVHGTSGVVAPGVWTTPEEVKDGLEGKKPPESREYVDIEELVELEKYEYSGEILEYDGFVLSTPHDDHYMLMNNNDVVNDEEIKEGETVHYNVEDGLVTEAKVEKERVVRVK